MKEFTALFLSLLLVAALFTSALPAACADEANKAFEGAVIIPAKDASFTEGYTGTATFYLKYKGTIALSFKLTYTVEPKPEVIPNETKFSNLTILSGVDVVVNQKPRSNYDADAVTVAVPTLLLFL